MKKLSEKKKKQIIDLITQSEFYKAFEEIKKYKIRDQDTYNELKKDFLGGGLVGS